MKVKHVTQYLFESYKDAQAKFAQEASEDEVKQYLDIFKELTKKGTVSGQEKDIGYWIKQGWNKFREFVDNKSQEKSKSQVKKSKKKDSIVVRDDEQYFMVIPLTREASCFYGKNTQWCTAYTESRNQFPNYFYIDNDSLLYIFVKDNQEKFAVRYSNDLNTIIELRNENDVQIDFKKLNNKTGMNKEDIESIFQDNMNIIQKARNINNLNKETLIDLIEHIPPIIRNIDNPSEDVQLAAINKNVESIRFIENPTDKVIETALQNDAFDVIKSIDKNLIDEKFIWKALKIEPKTINIIADMEGYPTQHMVNYVFQYNPSDVLHYYDNITEKQAWHVIKHDIDAIDELYQETDGQYPNQEMTDYVFKHKPNRAIAYIDNPSVEQQMKAVNSDPFSIRDMKNADSSVQIEALKQYPTLIQSVPNPSKEAIEYIIDLNDDRLISKLFLNNNVIPQELDDDLKKKIRQVMGIE